MPANKKHLTKSGWLRLVKILIGTLGGYAVMFSFHLLLTKVFPPQNVIATSFITGYLLWAILLLTAFTHKSIWNVFGLYFALTMVFSGIYYFV